MPEMIDTDGKKGIDEWLFTSNTGEKMDLLPILQLISMHHESYEEHKLAKSEKAEDY